MIRVYQRGISGSGGGAKVLVDVIEELKTPGSGTWIVPDGCESVEVFAIGAGNKGTNGGWDTGLKTYIRGGGGSGGSVVTKTISVTAGQPISYSLGKMQNTIFGDIKANRSMGAEGGSSYGSEINGGDGVYPFNDSSLGYKRMGAGGGAGVRNVYGTGLDATQGRSGDYGGGNGSDGHRLTGYDATYYGSGGGGGAGRGNGQDGESVKNAGGDGYQGIIILRYKKYE